MRMLKKDKMKACGHCGEILGYSHFIIWRKNASMTKSYFSKNCKPCIKREQAKVQAIKKVFPPPKAGTPCACCGKVDRLVVDHDWSIDDPKTSFRGYICKSCNVGMGHLGDSLAGVQKAVDYLKRAEIRSTGLKWFDAFAMDTEQQHSGRMAWEDHPRTRENRKPRMGAIREGWFTGQRPKLG